MTRSLLLAAFLMNLVLFSFGQLPEKISPQIIARLDSLTTLYSSPRTPGVASAIIRDGKKIYEKYEGLAELVDSSAIGSSTRFNIASNAKQFTALAILKLEQEKKLSLDQDIRHFFPGLYPGIKQKISIQHLLTHTSGIRDFYDLLSLQGITWWKNSLDNQDVLNMLMRQKELNFLPGTQYLYSNSNYVLMALIIGKASGQSFLQYTQSLFDRLGMKETSFCVDTALLTGQIAKAYFNFQTWTTYAWKWKVVGDGNLFSSMADQVQWERILQGENLTDLDPAVIQKSQEFSWPANPGSYGYGLEKGVYKNRPILFHEGATGASKAMTIRFTEERISFITLTNSGRITPNPQNYQLADIFLNLPANEGSFLTRPVNEGKPVLEKEILGFYTDGDRFYFQFIQKDSALFLRRYGRNDVKLERESSNVFHQVNDPAFKQEFILGQNGKWEVTAYYTAHAPYTLSREALPGPAYDFTTWNGQFRNEEIDLEMKITYQDNLTYSIILRGNDTTTGILLAPDRLLFDGYLLKRVPKGKRRTDLLLFGNRIRAVRFVRQ